jgi:predicted transcriptional regulator
VESVVKKGLAKALERRMGLDEGILVKIETKGVESSLLMNKSRREIFQFICNNPCVHLREISRAMDFSPQTAKWHLEKLISGKLISMQRLGNKMIFSPLTNFIKCEECRNLALFYQENIKKIYLYLTENPGKIQRQLIEGLNIYQQLISRALVIMERHNVISHKMQGRTKVYFITDLISKIETQFDLKAKDFEKMLISALKADGVAPRILHSNPDILKIEIDSGSKKRSILKIYKNPVRAVLN